jgi:hypothetical protein
MFQFISFFSHNLTFLTNNTLHFLHYNPLLPFYSYILIIHHISSPYSNTSHLNYYLNLIPPSFTSFIFILPLLFLPHNLPSFLIYFSFLYIISFSTFTFLIIFFPFHILFSYNTLILLLLSHILSFNFTPTFI